MNLKIEGDRKHWFLRSREIFLVNELCFFLKADLYIIKLGLMYKCRNYHQRSRSVLLPTFKFPVDLAGCGIQHCNRVK